MKKKLSISVVLIVVLSCVCALGLDFTHSASIKGSGSGSGSRKYKAIQLTADVYNRTKPNLADLMLYNENNEPIPYFINSFTDTNTESQKTYDMEQIDAFLKKDRYYLDFTLRIPQTRDVTATSLELEANADVDADADAGSDGTDFVKKVVVWGGYDGVNWNRIMEDTLYAVDANRKLEIRFTDVLKYTFYRLELSNNLEKVAFPSARLKYNELQRAREYYTSKLDPKYTIEQKGSDTLVKLTGLLNLKLCSITLKTDSMFKRTVSFDNQPSKQLYHLQFNDNVYQDLTIPLGSYVMGSETSSLTIRNGDDKPIDIKGIEISYLVDELIFDGSGSDDYTLRFGNPSIQEPKSYDVASYSEQILKQGYDVLNLGKIKAEAKAPEVKQLDYKLIFNVTIVAAAAVMGFVLLRKLKK
jgi:hypothetical protein